MIRAIRTQVFWFVVALCILFAVLRGPWLWGLAVTVPLLALGIWDLFQTRHNLLRNYPLVGHLRYLIEGTGAEMRQYVVESNTEGMPFNRDQRSLIYQRAKNVTDKKPFGTECDVYDEGYGLLAHTMAPKPLDPDPVANFRVDVGAPGTPHPYSCSVYNISAMSFGSLSGPAIEALNRGARAGRFAHITGEGSISRYHREGDGDLIWQIGTGYFGCRADDGTFDPEQFRQRAEREQVKMIELKISQGAKPGHGGILPGSKVTEEIADARGIPVGKTCVSPAYHTAFDTPTGLLQFIARLRELSGGKPVGFKLCIGRPHEFYAICKAILETGILPDFITVDGAEGGTGAAPIEFSDHLGLPLREALLFVRNALVGLDIDKEVRIAAAGKRVSAFDIAQALALGADWCNTARGFMMAIGCIQAQACHTNECPVGVATQNPRMARAIHVPSKAERVHHFHRNTLEALAEVTAAAGLSHPREFHPRLIYERTSPTEVRSLASIFDFYAPGQLRDGRACTRMQPYWDAARPDTFASSQEWI
ncbi:MAG: FMN-binding glutamate synthase family protein [Planctomycetota bacterium]